VNEKIAKLFFGDYSSDGYNNGVEDGTHNIPKNKFKFFKVTHPINYVWNFNNAYDSFMKNYDNGYLDGQRVKNEIYNTNSSSQYIKGVNMQDSYENHIRMLEVFEASINRLKEYSDSSKEQYAKQLMSMEGAGFVQNITNPLQQKYQEFSSKIRKLHSMIEEHKRKINIQKEALQQLSQIARGN
jgi:hypothetical protein